MDAEQNTTDNTEETTEIVEETILNEEETTEDKTSEEPTEVVKPVDADTMDVDELEDTLEAQKEAIFKSKTEEVERQSEEDNEDKTSEIAEEDKTEQPTKVNKHAVKVTKEYIAEQPEEHRTILESALGSREHFIVDKQILKNYVNAQVQINKDKAEIERLRNEKQVPDFTKEDTDQVTQITNELVEAELRAKYPDMPSLSDQEALNEWRLEKGYNDPDFNYDFREKMRKLEAEFRKEAENEVSLAKNWQGMAKMQTEKELNDFEEYVKSKGFSLSDLGVDREDAEFIKSILFNEDGKNNEQVIQMYRGKIPVVMNGRVLSLLKDRYVDKLIELASIKARTEGYAKRESLKPNPSLNNTSIAGKTKEILPGKKDVKRFRDDEDVETLKEKLELQKDSLGLGAGTSII